MVTLVGLICAKSHLIALPISGSRYTFILAEMTCAWLPASLRSVRWALTTATTRCGGLLQLPKSNLSSEVAGGFGCGMPCHGFLEGMYVRCSIDDAAHGVYQCTSADSAA
jgi:hypothetical protein